MSDLTHRAGRNAAFWESDVLIDFAKAHKEYLQGRSEGGQWIFNLANPQKPAAWKHLASHQIFSNNALGLAIAVRNQVSENGSATAVFAGMRLSFSSKIAGRYPLKNDPGKISITLGLDAVRYLYSWLKGQQTTFRYDMTRKGEHPKSVTGFNANTQFTHTLRIASTENDGSRSQVEIGLDAGDTFAISMFCVGFAQLLYPSFSSELIADQLLVRGQSPELSTQAVEKVFLPHANDISDPDRNQSSTNLELLEDRGGHEGPSPGRLKAQKAVYAVGINKWPHRNLKVIEYIQETASIEAMDRLIKAGNRGDFSDWERLEGFL
jgi:hypothetical protein